MCDCCVSRCSKGVESTVFIDIVLYELLQDMTVARTISVE